MREIGPDVASNRVDARRAVVIVMDDVQATPAADPLIPLAKTIANAAIDGLGPTDLAAVVYVLNRGRGQEFTLDRTRLRAAVDRFVPAEPTDARGSLFGEQAERRPPDAIQSASEERRLPL